MLKRVVAGQAEPVAIAGPIAGEAQSWERRDRSAPRHTRHSPQRRRSSTQPVRRSAVEWDAAALPVLATEPQMSTAELARQLGTSERNAGRIRARLASPDS